MRDKEDNNNFNLATLSILFSNLFNQTYLISTLSFHLHSLYLFISILHVSHISSKHILRVGLVRVGLVARMGEDRIKRVCLERQSR